MQIKMRIRLHGMWLNARVLGISRESLHRHMKRFGIEGGQSARGLRVKLAQGLILWTDFKTPSEFVTY